MTKKELLIRAEAVAKAAGLSECPVNDRDTNAEIEDFIESMDTASLVVGKVAIVAAGGILAPGTIVTDQFSTELISSLKERGFLIESV